MKTIEERFWPKVQITPACWEWQACLHPGGYGYLGRAGAGSGAVLAHRYSWELHNGPIPPGFVVRHKCDNPPCVNPDHLELGTQADNVRDKVDRGRSPRGERNAQAKVSARDVLEMRRSAEPQRVLAGRYGITQSHVSAIRLGKRWAHLEGENE